MKRFFLVVAILSPLAITQLMCRYPYSRLLAEWETQDACMVSFRTQFTDNLYDSVTIPLIGKLSQHIKTYILIENDTLLPNGLSFFAKRGTDTSNLRLVYFPLPDFWLRDWGPVLVLNKKGSLTICNCRYDRNRIGSFTFYDYLNVHSGGNNSGIEEFTDLRVNNTFLVLEGGAIESNGRGTLILADSLIMRLNPGHTRKQIEREFSRIMGTKTFIWLKYGLCQDPFGSRYLGESCWVTGSGGHTDHFVRFANDSTILLYWEFDTVSPLSEIKKQNLQRMSDNLKLIENIIDHRGRKFKVIKVPSPGVITRAVPINKDAAYGLAGMTHGHENDSIRIILPSGYLNYLITNGLVIIPKYADEMNGTGERTDKVVFNIFSDLYPDREIVMINPMILNFDGGGMHCIYKQIPSKKLPY